MNSNKCYRKWSWFNARYHPQTRRELLRKRMSRLRTICVPVPDSSQALNKYKLEASFLGLHCLLGPSWWTQGYTQTLTSTGLLKSARSLVKGQANRVWQRGLLNVGKCVVCIVPRLTAGRPGVRNLARRRDFSLLQNVQTGSGTHSASRSVGSFLGVNLQRRLVDHSPEYSADIKNE